MVNLTKDDFAGKLDHEGFGYFFWQGYYKYYKDIIPEDLYEQMEEFSKKYEDLRKRLQDDGWLL